MKSFFRLFLLATTLSAILCQRVDAQVANDSPNGHAGDYNPLVTTAGSYDPYTGNASRVIDDIVVAGAVGAYPLKWSRRMNTREITRPGTFGAGGGWSHSYQWELAINHPTPIPSPEPSPHDERADGTLKYPDGRSVDLDSPFGHDIIPAAQSPFGMMDRFQGEQGNGVNGYVYDLLMQDGGVVKFSKLNPSAQFPRCDAIEIVDPYKVVTTLSYEAGRLKTIKEQGGEHARYLEITYGQQTGLIERVEANDGFGNVTQWVNYVYEPQTFNGQTALYLTHANYSGGDTASYVYQQSNRLPEPYPTPPFEGNVSGLISTCDDPRFAGPLKHIKYELRRTSSPAYGEIWKEENVAGDVLSRLEIPSGTVTSRKEYRGNDVREFRYSIGGYSTGGILTSRSDFEDHWVYFAFQSTGTVNIATFKDERGYITEKWLEGDFQATTRVVYPDSGNPYVKTEYENPNFPFYVKNRWDERVNKTEYVRNADHSIESIHYPNGTATGRDYPEFPDSPSEPIDSFTYSANGFRQIETHTIPNGGTEHYQYDDRGLKQFSWPAPTSSDPNPGSHKTHYVYYTGGTCGNRYDLIDRLQSVEDPRGNITSYEYNERGQVTRLTHPNTSFGSSSIESHYYPDGTLEWVEDELHHRTNYEYDEYKRVTHVKRTVEGNLEDTKTDYAPPGTTINPLWHTTSSIYRITSPELKTIDYEYDRNFRRTKLIQASGTNDVATTEYHYDDAGNLAWVKDPRGYFTHYEYDERNRQKSIRNDTLDETTLVGYDPASNKVREERPDHTIRSWDYDSMNRLHHAYDWRTTEEATQEQTTTYGRDSGGVVRYIRDTEGEFYRYDYDLQNRKITATYPPDATSVHRYEQWHYDFAGNMDLYTNPTGQLKHLHYDPRNRVDYSYWTSTVGGVPGPDITTVYDDASRIKRVSTNSFETIVDFDYDEANRQKWEEQTLALPNETPITHRINTPLDHDGLRQTLELIDPPSLGGNLSTSIEMTGSGSLSISYHYTGRSQVDHIGGGPGENWGFTYKYDPSGNLSWRRADFNGFTNWTKCPGAEHDAYDALNRPTMWEQSGLNGLYTLSHHNYDKANREISTWRPEDGKGERYAYEPTNQLTGVGYNATNVSTWPPPGAERLVTYDYAPGKLNRNVVTETLFGQTPTTQSYTNDPLNQYLTVGGNGYSYDTNFNLTHAGTFFGVYNTANQLISASDGGSFIAGFVYDGLGRCVKRTLGNEATVFVYDGWKPIGEFDTKNNFKAWNLYGPGADEILLRNKGDMGYTIFLLDRHGNVAFLVDNVGHLREKYTYDVFGKPTIINALTLETISTPWYSHDFLFQGREYISQLGIYDYRNRFYLPTTGRFLQTDPKGFDAGDMNLFRYCGDDPVDLSDPMGLDPMYVPDDVDFHSRAAALETERLSNRSTDGMERNIAVFQDKKSGNLYSSSARVGWKDPKNGRLRSAPPRTPAGSVLKTSNHNHPNGGPLSGEDRVASDNRHAPSYARGQHTERWRPDADPAKAARHEGGIRESWSERGQKWNRETTPRLPGADRSSMYSAQADPGNRESSGPSAATVDAAHQATGVPSLGAEAVNFAPGRP